MQELSVKIVSISHSNKITGFCVFRAKDDESNTIVVKGAFPGVSLSTGLKLKIRGKFETHSTFGEQFNASNCEVVAEKGKSGVVAYLIHHVKSIGPVTASRLYDAFGDDLVRILESDPEKISTCEFLNKAQVEAILQEWAKSSENRNISIFLLSLGLSNSQIRRVIERFGDQGLIAKIQANPYLLFEVDSIGFLTADTAARKLNISTDSPSRMKASIIFAMREISFNDGHMYTDSKTVKKYIEKLFKRSGIEFFGEHQSIPDRLFYNCVVDLQKENQLIAFEDKLYLAKNWYHESKSSEYLGHILNDPPPVFPDFDSYIKEFEQFRGIALAPEQLLAIDMLKKSRVLVISGYPGTGKTLLMSAFVYVFDKLNLQFQLMAPTGIAAKRLSQATGRQASTIHRALGYKGENWEFNEFNKYSIDVIICDECSMLDSSLFYCLVRALRKETILILVGDSAQLPSVGPGYVLNNLLRCNRVNSVYLKKIFRQDGVSDIIKISHQMLRNEEIDISHKPKSEVVFIQKALHDVIHEVSQLASLLKQHDKSFQTIAPMYDGDIGINSLNSNLRSVLNTEFASGKSVSIKHGDTDLYEGDRVLFVKNDYERALYNGDAGKVTRISMKDDEVDVKIFDWFNVDKKLYEDKIFTLKVEEARLFLKVAFATSAHKSQGMEFDYIILPMTMKYGIMLYRNLVYTAMTRAKKKVFIIGDCEAFRFAAMNDREVHRNSLLSLLVEKNNDLDVVGRVLEG